MLGHLGTCPFIWLPSDKILSEETFHQRLPFKGAEESWPWCRHHLTLDRIPWWAMLAIRLYSWEQGDPFLSSSMGPPQEINGEGIPSGVHPTSAVLFLMGLVTQGFPSGLRKHSSLLVGYHQTWVSPCLESASFPLHSFCSRQACTIQWQDDSKLLQEPWSSAFRTPEKKGPCSFPKSIHPTTGKVLIGPSLGYVPISKQFTLAWGLKYCNRQAWVTKHPFGRT